MDDDLEILLEELQLSLEDLQRLRQIGIIDEIALRNIVLRKEFKLKCNENRRKKGRGESAKVIELLANKFNMGIKAVERAVYDSKSRKKANFF